MNRLLKKLLILGLALCMVFAGGALAACGGETEKTTTRYTVTVTCEDSSALAAVKVQLKKADGSLVQESALTDGKATFELEPATYTATLTGVPESYSFENGSLTETTTSCTIALTKENGKEEEKSYDCTVTVQLPDETAAKGITVWLIGTDNKASSAATDDAGVARFKLQKGVYQVNIEATDWPQNIIFDNNKYTLTVEDAEAALTVRFDAALIAYEITVTYPEVKDVYENPVAHAGPAENVTVALYEGKLDDDRGEVLEDKTPAATTTTDAQGKAKFSLPGELYTAVLSDYIDGLSLNYPEINGKKEYVITVCKDAPTYDVTFKATPIGSSSRVPLAFSLGDNTVPLSNTALSYSNGFGVYYAYTPEESGNYTISATGNAVVSCSAFQTTLMGGTSVVVALEAGTEYIFCCSASSAPVTYAVTIAKGGELSGGGGEHTEDEITYTITVVGESTGNDGQTVRTPLPGISVTLRSGLSEGETAVTDSEGKATFTLPASSYGVMIRGFGAEWEEENPEATYSVSPESPALTITLVTADLFDCTIVLHNADGSVVSGVTVKLVNLKTNKETSAVTDSNGVAHFKVAKGTYQVQVSKFIITDSGFVENGPQDVVIPPDKYSVTVDKNGVNLVVTYEKPQEQTDGE